MARLAKGMNKGMKLSSNSPLVKFLSRTALFGAMFIASGTTNARAAELVMFQQAGCVWCEVFDREIAAVYDKTDEGARAPLRRVNIAAALPPVGTLQVKGDECCAGTPGARSRSLRPGLLLQNVLLLRLFI